MSDYRRVQYAEKRVPRTDFPDKLVAYLVSTLPLKVGPARYLLELGSGRGDFADAWEKLGCVVYRVDRHLDAEDPRNIVLDLETQTLPWLPEFDVVFSKSLIEHLRDPTNMLSEANRVLIPGGFVVVMTPDWRTYYRTFYDDYTHVRPYDEVSMRDLLEVHGFELVSVERVYQYPPIWSHPWLRLLAFLWRWLVPQELSLWLTEKTGVGFFKWSSQLTVLAVGMKI